jgi:hypothetical protein
MIIASLAVAPPPPPAAPLIPGEPVTIQTSTGEYVRWAAWPCIHASRCPLPTPTPHTLGCVQQCRGLRAGTTTSTPLPTCRMAPVSGMTTNPVRALCVPQPLRVACVIIDVRPGCNSRPQARRPQSSTSPTGRTTPATPPPSPSATPPSSGTSRAACTASCGSCPQTAR